ncbi:hypothetical protein [Campylobacter lanienae]|uniref:Uncharacterized protein n=1 Tax=Campylobacter lanienae NCTC 13004 TaxID=1031753 RepID=A0A1X9SKZ6_9BACT|nr:hypothetical protein [Campylobacter lanienae]ARQ96917.1 hypothetical protein CLAN_0141 [Campylobacter lanienae NCTC 13004]MCI7364365.1 hypothetical protein [Campylobacter lanienae]
MRLKEKLAGTILLCALVPLAIIGYIYITIVGTFGDPTRARQGVRALDHFVNATIFNGYAWESVSSHAWRMRHKRWAKIVIFITDKFQKNHCQRANKREQPIIDLMLSRRLNEQTIGKRKFNKNS